MEEVKKKEEGKVLRKKLLWGL